MCCAGVTPRRVDQINDTLLKVVGVDERLAGSATDTRDEAF
jgi:hypothetical protein